MAAVEIMQLKHIIILQNKIDLIGESVATNQHEAIQVCPPFHLILSPLSSCPITMAAIHLPATRIHSKYPLVLY